LSITFYEIEKRDNIKGSVIIAKDNDGYVMVQHKERDTWECPGGHVEKGETPLEAAKRELFEESGAIDYTIAEICDYSILINDVPTMVRLFYSEIESYSNKLFHEIETVKSFREIPKNLTYPIIHPILVDEVNRRLDEKYDRNRTRE
jgi:8-oxo-dGTP diphosphatase